MVNQKYILLFYLTCFGCFIFPVFSFYNINNTNSIKPPSHLDDNINIMYSIDECIISTDSVKVNGWATPSNGINKYSTNTEIYLAEDNDNLIMVPKFTNYRPDVIHYIGKKGDFDKSGFSASISLKNIKWKSKKIAILIENDNKIYMVQHECK